MKKLLNIFLLLVPLLVFGQQDTTVMRSDLRLDNLTAPPRQRVSRVTSLTLNNTGVVIPFVQGASTLDVNTFPQARWDYTNNKLITNPGMGNIEQAYDLHFDMAVTTSVFAFYKIQIQFVIPSPTPFYFPYPDLPESERWVDVANVMMVGTSKIPFDYPIYTNATLRQYGCQIRIRYLYYNALTGLLSTLTSGHPVLTYCSLNIYAK